MEPAEDIPQPKPQRLKLTAGAQVVINGALVTVHEPCSIEVGSGAFVLTGRSLARESDPLRHPREELYFSMLEVGTDAERFAAARFRLFRLLSQVVAQEKTQQGQSECATCASAIMSGDMRSAVASASRLASARLEEESRPRQAALRQTRA